MVMSLSLKIKETPGNYIANFMIDPFFNQFLTWIEYILS